ncbi:glycosyltransferase [Carnobacterium divergens]|nr:glycosyltransferase [Carnobacterium divergens]MDO0875947.1 glycosyltransferase [Carnobacterium divergens]MDT1959280.1 glycosyltransferase [Carnobacterium divergens]MDT1975298.1 glycosyltransferase [Carnobacterium divergens]SUX15506.1 Poly-beta-1,6-N-acetyl-D-glucosamine synthase [Carnobacterium divergens]
MQLIIHLISSFIVGVFFFYIILMIIMPVHKEPVKKKKVKQLYYVFLIPCLNEEKVIKRTIYNLLKLRYKRMMIIPIDDASDDRTAKIIEGIKDKRVRLLKRTKPNAQKGKGAALNDAYKRVLKKAKSLNMEKEVVIAIIDGDGRLGTNVIREANRAFSNKAVCAAQCRVRIINTQHILPFLQDVEFFTMISDIQNVRSYIQSVGLGGNGQFTRLTALKALGKEPWGDSLLEDYDMTLRLLLRNGKISYLSNGTVYQQGLSSVKKLIYQRSRWVQGNIQCLKYLKKVKKSKRLKKEAKLDIYYFLAQPFINLIGSIIFFMSWVWITISFIQVIKLCIEGTSSWISLFLYLGLLILITSLPGFVFTIRHYFNTNHIRAQKGNTFIECFFAGFAMTVYNIITIPSVWIAFKRYLLGENSWLKTERE